MSSFQAAPSCTPCKPGRRPDWPVIRERRNRRGTSWRVDAGRFNGPHRYVKQFKSQVEAEQHAEKLRAQRAAAKVTESRERKPVAVDLTALTDEQRADALAAFRVLKGTSGTLKAAATFWKAHAAPADARTVAQVFAELVQAMKTANRRPRSVQEMVGRLGGFVDEYGKTAIATLTTPDLEAWINNRCQKLSARTRTHFRRVLHRLFSHAAKRGYREANPVAAIEKPSPEQTVPEIVKPGQVRRLLEKAAEIRPEIVPYLAIGFFSGLRSTEIDGLDWKQINFQKQLIYVDPATAKKRRSRYVKLEPNLAAWLTAHRQGDGRVFYSRRALRFVQEQRKVTIPYNGARHSYGSHHLAAYEDAGKTAAMLGHTNDTSVLFSHYRALVKPSEARAYWEIKPVRVAFRQARQTRESRRQTKYVSKHI
jgi:site-specific recombinase XerD